jgi:hypothetical protein
MIQKAGFDLIWFGIFIVLLVEIAEVTPPVGFNLFVLQNMTGKDSNTIARAAMPFFGCLVVCIVLITVFPQIVTSAAGPGDGQGEVARLHKSDSRAHGGVARCSESSCTASAFRFLRSGRLALHPGNRISGSRPR